MSQATILHLGNYRKPRICIPEKMLTLIQYLCENYDPRSHHLIGSLFVDDDEKGLTIQIDRLDICTNAPLKSTGLSVGGVALSFKATLNEACDKTVSTDDILRAFELLQSRSCSRKSIHIYEYIKLFGFGSFYSSARSTIVHLYFHLLMPDTKIIATPGTSVPVVLSQNLVYFRNLSSLEGSPNTGYLILDSERVTKLILESDPRHATWPTIGIWVAGINSLHHPFVWASCVRYTHLQERAGKPEKFLLMLYRQQQTRPDFYKCEAISDDSDVHFQLITGHVEKMLARPGSDDFLEVKMTLVQDLQKSTFDAAVEQYSRRATTKDVMFIEQGLERHPAPMTHTEKMLQHGSPYDYSPAEQHQGAAVSSFQQICSQTATLPQNIVPNRQCMSLPRSGADSSAPAVSHRTQAMMDKVPREVMTFMIQQSAELSQIKQQLKNLSLEKTRTSVYSQAISAKDQQKAVNASCEDDTIAVSEGGYDRKSHAMSVRDVSRQQECVSSAASRKHTETSKGKSSKIPACYTIKATADHPGPQPVHRTSYVQKDNNEKDRLKISRVASKADSETMESISGTDPNDTIFIGDLGIKYADDKRLTAIAKGIEEAPSESQNPAGKAKIIHDIMGELSISDESDPSMTINTFLYMKRHGLIGNNSSTLDNISILDNNLKLRTDFTIFTNESSSGNISLSPEKQADEAEFLLVHADPEISINLSSTPMRYDADTHANNKKWLAEQARNKEKKVVKTGAKVSSHIKARPKE